MTKTNFLPFGESFSVYDDFYINSNEVFRKRGALITMHMTVDTNQYVEEEEPSLWALNGSLFYHKKSL